MVSLSLFAGCGTANTTGSADPSPTTAYEDVQKIPYNGIDVAALEDGAASVEREFDVIGSSYFVHPDFYNMKSNNTLTILPKFKTYQQTTEWTCGPAAVLMVLEYYGKLDGKNDLDLAALRGDATPSATSVEQMVNIFEAVGGFTIDETHNYADLEDINLDLIHDYLKQDVPVMVEWVDWGGHWQAIIGYDTMGTDTVGDDVLIMADPYDTTDHNQDGYYIVPAERFLYTWVDGTIFPEGEREKNFVAAWPSDKAVTVNAASSLG